MGKPKALAIWDACKEIAFPKLLILFCILAVFAPAFTMGGIPGSLFVPLALAIGFSMITHTFWRRPSPIMSQLDCEGTQQRRRCAYRARPDWQLKEEMAHHAQAAVYKSPRI